MMKKILLSLFILSTTVAPTYSQTVVATRTIQARSIIEMPDLTVLNADTARASMVRFEFVGKEALSNIYTGQVIRGSDVAPPAILTRNQHVVMMYLAGLLTISAEGRVLERAGVGDMVRVMNLESRMTVSGRVLANGTIEVGF